MVIKDNRFGTLSGWRCLLPLSILGLLLLSIASKSLRAQVSSEWLYVDSLTPRISCQPTLVLTSDSLGMLLSCLHTPAPFSRRLYNIELDRVSGSIAHETDVFNPVYSWIELIGTASSVDEKNVVRGIPDERLYVVTLSATFDTTDVELVSEFANIVPQIASVGDKILVASYSETGICLNIIRPDHSTEQFCVPNLLGLKPVAVVAYGSDVYIGLEGSMPVSPPSGNELGLVKFDTSGNHKWTSIFYATPGSEYPVFSALKFFTNGDVALIGRNNEGVLRGNDLIAVRFSGLTGDQEWNVRYSLSTELYGDQYLSSYITHDDHLQIVGMENETPFPSFGNYFFLQIGPSGEIVDSTVRPDFGFSLLDAVAVNDAYLLFGYRGESDFPLMVIGKDGTIIAEYNYTDINSLALNRDFQIHYESNGEVYLFARLDFDYLALARVGIDPISYISEPNSLSDLQIIPNPNNGIFKLKCSLCRNLNISLISPLGKTVYQSVFTDEIIDVRKSSLGKGIYYVVLSDPEGRVLFSAPMVIY